LRKSLSIFRDQLTKANGQLRDELSKDVIRVQREFDLGNNDGALARLVSRVEDAQKKITGEFTLDNTSSALSRLKGEIVGLLEQLRDRNTEFQRDVKAAVDSLRAVRGERDKTTAGGQDLKQRSTNSFSSNLPAWAMNSKPAAPSPATSPAARPATQSSRSEPKPRCIGPKDRL
jgi:hypothetical protein